MKNVVNKGSEHKERSGSGRTGIDISDERIGLEQGNNTNSFCVVPLLGSWRKNWGLPNGWGKAPKSELSKKGALIHHT